MISLEGKTALVTGAASGIGAGIARRLAEAGADIVLLDIDAKNGLAIEKEIRSSGTKAKFYACDVGKSPDCRKAVDDSLKYFGRIDILVNNAGVISRKSVVELSEEEWDFVLRVNLKSLYLLSHLLIPHMIQNGGGCVINIGSGWGIKGGPDAAAYCASKGGVVNLTRAMAIDHGKQGVRINCVCPGDVKTGLLEMEADQIGRNFDEFLAEASARPLPRVGNPGDVANAVLFLSSEMASWITGSVFVVDGGGLA
jgi:NAD(P)-dependent dehydrogenase (short-subunit alcohol dehydrogenase family)